MSQVESKFTRRMPTLRVGDVVEVLSAEEILRTLDDKGEFENLPFMPEMLSYCGRQMTVYKVAHKLCEVITGDGGLRWMNNAVHLSGARCSGDAHGGCQTACTLYWKEAWLRRVVPAEQSTSERAGPSEPTGIDTSVLTKAANRGTDRDGNAFYSCQATEILRAAPDRIRFWNLDQYVADVKSGNVGMFEVIRTFLFHLFNVYQARSRRLLPRWLLIKEGLSWGFVKGRAVGKTPIGRLDLQVGEVVRIKSKDKITLTLDSKCLNRGLGFEEEMARSCGTVAKVTRRVDRCIDEKTGKLLAMKHPCIVLEGVTCRGVYHGNCPREYIPFWREIWLERVRDNSEQAPEKRSSES